MLASGWGHQCEPMVSGGARTEVGNRRERAIRAPQPQSGVGVRVGLGRQDRWGIQSVKIWVLQLGSGRQKWEGPGVGREGGFMKGNLGRLTRSQSPPRAFL